MKTKLLMTRHRLGQVNIDICPETTIIYVHEFCKTFNWNGEENPANGTVMTEYVFSSNQERVEWKHAFSNPLVSDSSQENLTTHKHSLTTPSGGLREF